MAHQATLFNQVPPCVLTFLKAVDGPKGPLLVVETVRRSLNFTPSLEPDAIAYSLNKERELWI